MKHWGLSEVSAENFDANSEEPVSELRSHTLPTSNASKELDLPQVLTLVKMDKAWGRRQRVGTGSFWIDTFRRSKKDGLRKEIPTLVELEAE